MMKREFRLVEKLLGLKWLILFNFSGWIQWSSQFFPAPSVTPWLWLKPTVQKPKTLSPAIINNKEKQHILTFKKLESFSPAHMESQFKISFVWEWLNSPELQSEFGASQTLA